MAALARFCTLGHLDLNLFCADQIFAGNTEPARCYLFDCGTSLRRLQAVITLAALTGVGFSVQTVHGNRQCLMCLLGNRTVGHRTCFESFYDRIYALNFFERNALLRIIEVHQTSQITALLAVNHGSVLFEHPVVTASCRLLQGMDGTGIVAVLLTLTSCFMTSETVQRQIRRQFQRIKCLRMTLINVFCNVFQCNTADTADRTSEVFVDYILRDTDSFEDLGTLIRLDRGDTHLRCDFYDAGNDCVVVIFNGCVVIFLDHALFDQLMDRVECQIRVDCAGTVAEQCCKMVHLARLAGLQNNRKRSSLFRFYQMLMNRRYSQEGWNRHMVLIDTAVRENQDVGSCPVCTVNLDEKAVHRTVKRCALVVGDRNGHCLEAFDFHVLDLQHIGIGQDRIVDL